MNKKVYFLAIVLLSSLVSCSTFNRSDKSEEVIFDDGYKTAANGEVVIDDTTFNNKENPIAHSRKSSQEMTQITKDGLQINVMYDSYGNKTETRTFNAHPLLKFILLRTAVDGSRQVFVYGQNGEVKSLPENMLDKVLTASSNELANSAGIFEGFKQQPSFAQNTQPSVTTLKPLPSSQFPIQNQRVEQTPPEKIEQPANTADKTAPADNVSQPSEKSETVKLNKKPDEQ